MNKNDLAHKLKQCCGISLKEASTVVDKIFDEITAALARGERVEIRGLCTFHMREYKGYTGRNPKTGQATQVKPKKLPFFRAGTDLKSRVDR
jgi:integration host factor subunit beta